MSYLRFIVALMIEVVCNTRNRRPVSLLLTEEVLRTLTGLLGVVHRAPSRRKRSGSATKDPGVVKGVRCDGWTPRYVVLDGTLDISFRRQSDPGRGGSVSLISTKPIHGRRSDVLVVVVVVKGICLRSRVAKCKWGGERRYVGRSGR